MPSSTETQLAADTQNNYQLVQELQQELVALEEELQGLRGQIDHGVTKKVAPYASYERYTLVADVYLPHNFGVYLSELNACTHVC